MTTFKRYLSGCGLVAVAGLMLAAAPAGAAAAKSPVAGKAPVPPAAKAAAPVPPPNVPGVVVLFSGKPAQVAANWFKDGTSENAAWEVKDGAMISHGGNIVSKLKFKDFQLHVEFMTPSMPDKTGQARGNSGVFCQGRYEIQVLDSYGVPDPGTGDCGAVYSQFAPLVKAHRPPLTWQTYDIIFRAPRFDDAGNQTEKPRVSVLLNGVAVQNNTIANGPTWGENFGALSDPGPIVLQDHGNLVKYRNVWILPLPEQGAQHY